MSNGDWLLDANIVIALFGGDRLVVEKLATANEIFLSAIVLGELYFGVHRSQRVDANLSRLEDFAASVTVLPVSRATAIRYGVIKGRLRALGAPIPDNDFWIASCATEHGLTLVTRDEHFAAVEGLIIERW